MPNAIADNLNRLVTAKTNIANAITEMGGTVNDGDGFESFSADIETIPSGGGGSDSFLSPTPSILSIPGFISTWSTKTWSGLTSFYGKNVWTDGTDIYYSNGSGTQYVLNKGTSTWTTKTWSGLTPFDGQYIWTDGSNVYYSNGSNQYVLNKDTSTWTTKRWTGFTSFDGNYIWTDGTNIYYSYYNYSTARSAHYVLNKGTSTWSTMQQLTNNGNSVWTDGTKIYYSNGQYIWTDGTDIYYSNGSTQNVLNKRPSVDIPTTKCNPKFGK